MRRQVIAGHGSSGARLVVHAVLALLSAAAAATTGAATLFESADPLRLRLEAPFGILQRDRRSDDPDYERARLLYYGGAEGSEVALELRVRVRGRFRRASCEFPPLLLNFHAAGTSGTGFEGENRLKLVTHCDSSASYDQLVLLEYLSYKTLNLLTEASLRVRLAEVSYYDSTRRRELGTRPAILVEPEERFAARHGWQVYAEPGAERARYDATALGVLDLFEYFIGNTDWSVVRGAAGEACCHNIVPFVRGDGMLVPVPYDFDSAGLVDAPYARPDDRLPIRDVRQRLYRGDCRTAAEVQETFRTFLAQREALSDLFRRQPGLSQPVLERTLEYIEQFYARLADAREIERVLAPACER